MGNNGFPFTKPKHIAPGNNDKPPDSRQNQTFMLRENLFGVLLEDSALLVLNKPAGLVCHPTKGDEYSSLISRVRIYLGPDSQPHLINRLDRETSGIVTVAKTHDAAYELRKVWENREVKKEYLAIVHGHVREDSGMIEARLGKDLATHIAVKDCVRDDGATAQTDFIVVRRFTRAEGNFTLLHVFPHTGRKHQIRIHLAHVGHPIVGDKLYGGDEDIYMALVQDRLTDEQRRRLILPWQALHAGAVTFAWRGENKTFRAEPEPWFCEFFAAAQAV